MSQHKCRNRAELGKAVQAGVDEPATCGKNEREMFSYLSPLIRGVTPTL